MVEQTLSRRDAAQRVVASNASAGTTIAKECQGSGRYYCGSTAVIKTSVDSIQSPVLDRTFCDHD